MFSISELGSKNSKQVILKQQVKEGYTQINIIQCNACEDTVFQNCNLKKHMKIVHHKEKKLKCSSYDYNADEIENLNWHIKQVRNKVKVFQTHINFIGIGTENFERLR